MPVPSAGPADAAGPCAAERDLQRARAAVVEAELSVRPEERYLGAQLAALRTAAVVLALRARPDRASRRHGPRNAWRLLADVAPEFGEWAAFFAATEGRRDAVRAGAWVGAREADDLVRDAQAFLGLVERVLASRLVPSTRGRAPVRSRREDFSA